MNANEFIKILIKHLKRFSLSREIKFFIYRIADKFPGISGNYLRWKVSKFFMNGKMGERVHIREHASFEFDYTTIGNNVLIGEYAILASRKGGNIHRGLYYDICQSKILYDKS